MEWTDIRLTVAKADADNAEAVATMIAEGGIYIEDYSDIEQQVAEIAHVDLIEQELLDKPRDTVIIHIVSGAGRFPRGDAGPHSGPDGSGRHRLHRGDRGRGAGGLGRTAGANTTTPWTLANGWPSCPPGRSTTPTASS